MPVAKFDVVLFGGTHHPQGFSRSTGLYRLATELSNNGYSVHVLDYFTHFVAAFSSEKRRDMLSKYVSADTLLVGISTTMLFIETETGDFLWWGAPVSFIKDFVADIKHLAPNAKIMVGGSQVSKSEIPFISQFYSDISDYWICGQSERSIIAVANHVKYGDPLLTHLIEGITVILEDDYPYNEFSRSRIEWPEHAFVRRGETLTMEVARGCVFKCAFCSYSLIGKKWGDMARDADVMRQDLIRNYEQHGTTRYILTDDTINDSMEKVRFLHDVFTSLPFQIEWVAYARLDLIWKHPEMAQILMDSGMRGAVFGIETLHEEAGKRVGKGLGPVRIKETLVHCKAVWGDKVHITGLFILGLPGEPVESMQETLRYLESPECPIDGANVTTLQISSERGTSKMDKAKETFGYKRIDERKWTHFEDWVTEHTSAVEMREMAKHFLNDQKRIRRPLYYRRTGFVLFSHLSFVGQKTIREEFGVSAAWRIADAQNRALAEYFEQVNNWEPTEDFVPSPTRISPVVSPKS